MASFVSAKNKVLKNGVHVMTSPYGMRTLNGVKKKHNGVDLVSNSKADGTGYNKADYITAYDGGTVTAILNTCSGSYPATGNYVKIQHAGGVASVYYHLKKDSVTVKKGESVTKGQVLGYMGSTGNSTGAHLHFGVSVNGKWVDPMPYLTNGEGETETTETGAKKVQITLDTIKNGYKGEQAKNLQILLNAKGYKGKNGKALTVDGVCGANTVHAIKAFQTAENLTADGMAGKDTLTALYT